jgi:LysR family transcriptional regulator, hydrogen peroxide-inducible genes activator
MEMHRSDVSLPSSSVGFREAAEKCNVSQPSLMRSMKRSEEEFGSVLFHSERANTHLSELGKMLVEARRLRHQIEAVGSR